MRAPCPSSLTSSWSSSTAALASATIIGLTVLSALLCAAKGAAYWKPVQTGAVETRGGVRAPQVATMR
jgi:hypothetical protein